MQLNQITLPVTDMAAAVDFYKVLGCQLIVDTPHYARFKAPENDTTLSLSLTEPGFSNGAVIYFESNDLDNQCQRLAQQGVAFKQQPTDQRYLWREAIIEDPSGNQIKLYHAAENRLNPPWAVTRIG